MTILVHLNNDLDIEEGEPSERARYLRVLGSDYESGPSCCNRILVSDSIYKSRLEVNPLRFRETRTRNLVKLLQYLPRLRITLVDI